MTWHPYSLPAVGASLAWAGARLAPADGEFRPEPDQARAWASEELAGTGYGQSPIERFFAWLADEITRLLSPGSTGSGPGLPSAPAVILLVALVALIVAVILRLRREPRGARAQDEASAPLFAEEMASAAEYRRRADEALAAGDASAAVLDGFRAAAAGLVERGVLDRASDRTAGEFGAALAAAFPGEADAARAASRRFDEARYGGLVPSGDQAREVLRFEERARGLTPAVIDAARAPRPLAVPR